MEEYRVIEGERLFEELVATFCGPFLVVRQLGSSRLENLENTGRKGIELLKEAVKGNENAVWTKFADFDYLASLLQSDVEDRLLDSLRKNDQEVGEVLDLTLDEEMNSHTKWFREWCVTLATLMRIRRHKKFEIPLERDGVVIFIDAEDTFKEIESALEDYVEFPLGVVYIGDEVQEEIKELIIKYNVDYCKIGKEGDDEDMRKLSEFGQNFIELCTEKIRDEVEEKQLSLRNVKVSSKILKSMESEDIIAKLTTLMCDELIVGQESIATSVQKSSIDHEIQAMAQIMSGVYKYRYKKVENKPQQGVVEEEESKPQESNTVISHLEKAGALFTKYTCGWESFLTSILMSVIGEMEEVNKLLSKNSVLELRTKSDYARSALCVEYSAIRTNRVKKKIFQMVMAGHLFNQAGMQNLSRRCYLQCIEHYEDWELAQEHLYSLLGTFDSNYLVNCLSILSNRYENKFMEDSSKLVNYEENVNENTDNNLSKQDTVKKKERESRDLDNTKRTDDKEYYYLKGLMKMKGFENRGKYMERTPISKAYGNYPTIYYEHKELPKLEGEDPFLVRIPIINLRKNGIIGTNVKLGTIYVDDLYEKLLNKSFEDQTWQRCIKLDNIKDHVKKGYFTVNQSNKGHNYMKNTTLILTLNMVNPLNLKLECKNFKVLLEKVRPKKVLGNKEIFELDPTKEVENFKWINCEVKSEEDSEKFEMREYESKQLVLTFRTEEVGSFRVVGVSWRLFDKVNFWTPIYTVGRKLKNHEFRKKITLDEFISQREIDKTLEIKIYEERPKVRYLFRKVGNLSKLRSTKVFSKKDIEFGNHDRLLKNYVEKYEKLTEGLQDDEKHEENENLCLFKYLDGESSLLEMVLQNLEDNPIREIYLRFKVLGNFKVSPYPYSYKFVDPLAVKSDQFDSVSTDQNNSDTTTSQNKEVNPEGDGQDLKEDGVECSWSVINLPNVKVKEESLTEKIFEVSIRFQGESTNLYKRALAIYFFLQPVNLGDGISLMDGSVCVKPLEGLDLLVPFKLFFKMRKGPTFKCYYNYKDLVKVHINNKTREEIEKLDFTVNEERIECSFGENPTKVSPNTKLNLLLPIRDPVNAIIRKLRNQSESLSFTAFWMTSGRFGVFTGRVDFKEYKLVVKTQASRKEFKLAPEPAVVDLVLTLQNVSTQNLDNLSISPIEDPENEFLVTFVGETQRNVQQLRPGNSVSLDYRVLLPLPGVYHFSPLSFKLGSSLAEKDVNYVDNTNTIVIYD